MTTVSEGGPSNKADDRYNTILYNIYTILLEILYIIYGFAQSTHYDAGLPNTTTTTTMLVKKSICFQRLNQFKLTTTSVGDVHSFTFVFL